MVPVIPDNTAVTTASIAAILGIIPIIASVAPIALNNNAGTVIIHILSEDCFYGEL